MHLPHSQRDHRRRALFLGLALLCVLATAFWIRRTSNLPLQPIPIPPDLNRMEPQLRSYLEQQVQAVAKAPTDPLIQSRLGLVFAANQLWPQALVVFQNASLLDPENPLPLLYQGVAHEELGALDRAQQFYAQTTKQHPSFPQGFARLGDIALRRGDLVVATAAFQKLIELAPNEWRGHAGLGGSWLQSGHAAQATNALHKAIQLEPKAKNAHHLLGLALRDLGLEQQARRHLRRGSDGLHLAMPDDWSNEAPQHMRLPQDLGEASRVALHEGRVQESANLLANALAYRPNSVSLLVHLAEVLIQMGQADKAMQLLDKATTLSPDHQPLLLTKAAALLELGRAAESLATADLAVARMPRTPQAHLARSLALQALDRAPEALTALDAAAAADPRNSLIHVEKGDLLWLKLARTNDAQAAYSTALQADPDLPEAHARLAELALQNNDRKQAALSIAALNDIDPTHPALRELQKRWKNPQPTTP